MAFPDDSVFCDNHVCATPVKCGLLFALTNICFTRLQQFVQLYTDINFEKKYSLSDICKVRKNSKTHNFVVESSAYLTKCVLEVIFIECECIENV